MLDHLEGVLANEPVEVVMGAQIVEVKPSGVTKGGVVERIMKHITGRGSSQLPDFVFCCGDDRSDEDMFRAVERLTAPKKGGQTEVGAQGSGLGARLDHKHARRHVTKCPWFQTQRLPPACSD